MRCRWLRRWAESEKLFRSQYRLHRPSRAWAVEPAGRAVAGDYLAQAGDFGLDSHQSSARGLGWELTLGVVVQQHPSEPPSAARPAPRTPG